MPERGWAAGSQLAVIHLTGLAVFDLTHAQLEGYDKPEMSPPSQIDYECFAELVRQLRIGGHTGTAMELHSLLHRIAWTTGSELVGELGLRILTFQSSIAEPGVELQDAMERCMIEVRRVWPDIK